MPLEGFSNPQLVTLAVALLHGDMDYVDREDIAISVNDIAPGRFSWRKHAHRIDLVTVTVALRDAKKAKNGQLLVGNNARGWMLSPAGIEWIKTVELADVDGVEPLKNRKHSISGNQEAACARLRSTSAYALFAAGEWDEISIQDFYDFARVNEYFQSRSRQRRYAIIDSAVGGDEVLSKLWAYLKHRFPEEVT